MSERRIVVAVPNISEGRRTDLVARIASDPLLLDVHSDPDHNRSMLTYAGPPDELVAALVATTNRAVDHLDLRAHQGVHPRFGVVDVLPFLTYLCDEATAIAAAHRFAREMTIPIHFYGSADTAGRTLPELRRYLRTHPGHPSAGVICVGVREPLVAFNVNLHGDISAARAVARRMRELPSVRALAFTLPSRRLVQVSMNLTEPATTGPRPAFVRAAELAQEHSLTLVDAEIVGLVPAPVLNELAGLPLRTPARSIEQALGDTDLQN